ncbi:Non-specific serine/threonine protein kinase protein [Dioscorea alata]|uniref:Non-specific serine/threonine protein kinase protein n=1 Tax=Dioscorea alata TaxID=55571 RepID=A0ACB7VG85_DIOAL|nr:Non-specific serine/threonine protein kinase protein [Dioscorea alata]
MKKMMMMFITFILFFFFCMITSISPLETTTNFTFNGFQHSNLHLDGISSITSNGLLRLTDTSKHNKSHVFFPTPLPFKNSSSGLPLSFSTSFIFSIIPEYKDLTGHGITFVLSHSINLSSTLPSQYLGLFNQTTCFGDPSNHVLAVELDTNLNPDFGDIDNNHLGIDFNSLFSIYASHASYSTADGFKNLSLVSGDPLQVWIEYEQSENSLFNVTIAPISVPKPTVPLISKVVNLSSLVLDEMYVGFTSSTGSFPTSHYILAWSFVLNGKAQAFDLSKLPPLPLVPSKSKPLVLFILLPVIGVILVLMVMAFVLVMMVKKRKKKRYSELLEDWETEYGPQRFSYKDLFLATKGFEDEELLGAGGFGRVYKGVLPKTNIQVAVKKVSHESRQGMREFIAEIISIGKLSHRNLVRLLGYCRREGELLLVYEFMPNGSLDRYLFNEPKSLLDWEQRYRIIKGVASGLLYLHEEWEQVVIHRDVKASNILLDCDMNGRLGDFGLSRLYDHGSDPQTTHVVGTLGYLAPELPNTGKANTSTDVYAFGGFLLELACGRRPIDAKAMPEEMILVDWVYECWKKDQILDARDANLRENYNTEEMKLVLMLGLVCSHPNPKYRPAMRAVMQALDGSAPIPLLSDECWIADNSTFSFRDDDNNTTRYHSLATSFSDV